MSEPTPIIKRKSSAIIASLKLANGLNMFLDDDDGFLRVVSEFNQAMKFDTVEKAKDFINGYAAIAAMPDNSIEYLLVTESIELSRVS